MVHKGTAKWLTELVQTAILKRSFLPEVAPYKTRNISINEWAMKEGIPLNISTRQRSS